LNRRLQGVRRNWRGNGIVMMEVKMMTVKMGMKATAMPFDGEGRKCDQR